MPASTRLRTRYGRSRNTSIAIMLLIDSPQRTIGLKPVEQDLQLLRMVASGVRPRWAHGKALASAVVTQDPATGLQFASEPVQDAVVCSERVQQDEVLYVHCAFRSVVQDKPAGEGKRHSYLPMSLDTAVIARNPSWILDTCQRAVKNRLKNCWPASDPVPSWSPTQDPVRGRIRAFVRLWRQALRSNR